MTDTTFSDSYIETDAALETLIGSDPRVAAVALKAAAAATQAWYCQEATRHIDQLAIRGTKYEYDQDLAFPRIIDGVVVGDGDRNAVVPDAVERACMEEAIAIYQLQSDPMAQQVATMQARGAVSASIGGEGSETWSPGAANVRGGMLSVAAYRLMRQYIGVVSR